MVEGPVVLPDWHLVEADESGEDEEHLQGGIGSEAGSA